MFFSRLHEICILLVPQGRRGRVVLGHLALSVLMAAAVSVVVFVFWFPTHLRHLAGGLQLFWTMVGVDVVCGPLLMLVLYRPTKTRRALAVDFSLIAVVQLSALAYGLNALAHARPLVMVFEVDRFRLVSYADIAERDVKHLPPWAQPWGLAPPRVLGVKTATSPAERLENFDLALQGVEIGQRPKLWQDYAANRQQVLERSKPLSALSAARPDQQRFITRAVADALNDVQPGETNKPEELRWLPLVSRRSLDWVVFLDPSSLRIRAYAPIDGFIQ